MANFRYFNNDTRLANVFHDGAVATKAANFWGFAPDGSKLQCTRKIEYKSNPSKHKCDARCTTAKGFKCECECGGKNHGIDA